MEIFGKAGCGASYMIGAFGEVVTLGDETLVDRFKMTPGRSSILKGWDYGAYSGLGLGFAVGPGKLLLETDAYLGFRNVESRNISQNRSLNFCARYMVRV